MSTITWSEVHKKKVIYKNVAQYVKSWRRKVRKLCISSIRSSKRGITPTRIDENWCDSNLIWSSLNESHIQNFSTICQIMLKNSAGKCFFSIKSSGRVITSTKTNTNRQHSNFCSTVKQSYVQNFSSISQSMQEKCTENCVFPIL